MTNTEIVIDGSIGGGSVLRVAVPIAIALNKTIKVTNIRARRKKPGLRLQHLSGCELLANLSDSILKGGKIGSTEIIVKPNKDINCDPQFGKVELSTAASVSLIIQALSNYVFASKLEVGFEFKGGGTHTDWSPNFDYLENVIKPLYKLFGVELVIDVQNYGFYPKGGARGKVTISPISSSGVILNTNETESISLISIASNHLKRASVAERQIASFVSSEIKFTQKYVKYVETSNPGSSITAIIKYMGNSLKGVSSLGKRGVRAEKIGKDVVEGVRNELHKFSSVDNYMADQLLVPLAFAPKESSYTISEETSHVNANLNVIKQILGPVIAQQTKGDIIELKRV